MTRMISLCCAIAATTLVPVAASAQSTPTPSPYCAALVQKYEQYIDMNTGHTQQPQSVEARAGVERCKAGDASGIPAVEKALRNAKIDLPPRG